MNSLIWLWLYSLVSAACDVNYAMWSPGFGMTVINDLIPALPQVSVEEFETINEGIDADKIGGGGTYTVPYSSEMTINKPAIWFGNCPKTLLLLGEETTQNTPMPSQQSTLSTSAKGNTNAPVPASETTPDHTTTSTAGTHKTADQTNSKPTGQATDRTHNKTPTLVKTGSKKATGSAGSEPTRAATDVTSQNVDPTTQTSAETPSPTAELWTCWTSKDRTLLDNTPKKTRMTAVNEFCRKFKEKPLTPKNRSSDVKQKDLALVAYVHLPCHIDKFEVDEIACLKYFEVIEKKCSDRGGSFQDGCALVWIAKPKLRNRSTNRFDRFD
ncbi:hypothetical protein FOQG_19598 [Fusarium oxysporum f. sp. raphani 54005]|uniref:Uncharacterized protein n=1 Tax=Fusarium oxysporum f. sp. raphani 54005 TaxID=1089458 RepID=X0B0J3_FUSOX|nr:hypothetical protein FOQG_19598 [Fusarium oxysporum f. sp. raphani 54005]